MWRSTLVLAACMAARAQSGNPDAAAIDDFQKRVGEYLKLHQKAVSSLGKLKPTASPEKILRHENQLGHKIRDAREHVAQGNIFTNGIAAAFHHLIGDTLEEGNATTVHQSLRRSEPVVLKLRVNHPYPPGLPLQTTPPSLLLRLPKLPPELEYRVVGHNLVLLDVGANLIVDFLPATIP